MIQGILGKKLGMTQVFVADGRRIPVTVVEAGPCTVVQKKTESTDGYNALQVGFEAKKSHRVNKPLMGHFKKADQGAFTALRELAADNVDEYQVGDQVTCDSVFKAGDIVDVTGTSKGKGFQGVVKRHGFSGVGDRTHGQHNRERAPGSIGGASYPSRVFKGMRMAGRTGGQRVKVANLKVLKIFPEQNLIVINGAIPGPPNAHIILEK